EGLPLEVTLAYGEVPKVVEVVEGDVRYAAGPWTGQKTGAFLDQRENRVLVSEHAGPGRALDLFTYHGSFALHLARRAAAVVAVASSPGGWGRGGGTAASTGSRTTPWGGATGSVVCARSGRRAGRFT